jgi:hypothetical protein
MVDADFAQAEIARLEEARLAAIEERIEATCGSGWARRSSRTSSRSFVSIRCASGCGNS